MLTKELSAAFNRVTSVLSKKQRAQIAEALTMIEESCKPQSVEVDPNESIKVLRLQLKLTWDTGHELTTDDYAVAAAHVGYKAKTLMNYLTVRKGAMQFPNPRSAGTITIAKVPVEKKAPPVGRGWVLLESVPNDFRVDGSWPIDEAAQLLRLPAQALKRRLTSGGGEMTRTVGDALVYVTRCLDAAPLENLEKNHPDLEKAKKRWGVCDRK